MSNASAPRTASIKRKTPPLHSSSESPGSYIGKPSSRKSSSSTSAPASPAASSARLRAARLLEPSRKVPPMPTTLKRPSSKSMLAFFQKSSRISGLSLLDEVRVQVGPHLRQEPVEVPLLPDAHTRKGLLLNPLPGAGHRPL